MIKKSKLTNYLNNLCKLGADNLPDDKSYVNDIPWFLTHRPLQWLLWAASAPFFIALYAGEHYGIICQQNKEKEMLKGTPTPEDATKVPVTPPEQPESD